MPEWHSAGVMGLTVPRLLMKKANKMIERRNEARGLVTVSRTFCYSVFCSDMAA